MIGIIDFGVGNVIAFVNAFNKLHIETKVITTKEGLIGVNKLILPGVGSFDYAMNKFNNSGIRNTIEKMVFEDNIPILGVCVGMQMLANNSEEGDEQGLGWIDGEVIKFNNIDIVMPHMGWNEVNHLCENSLFNGIEDKSLFYFLHSYYFRCGNSEDILGFSEYKNNFHSAVARENIYGVQFHPEKSHKNGLKLLRNFASL